MTFANVTLFLAMVVLAFVLTWRLTGRIRTYALAKNLVDDVNERSSHSVPTPRGGGLAIIAVVLPAIALASLIGEIPGPMAGGLLGAGTLVVLIGWIDDLGHVSPQVRLAAHTGAAALLAFFINPFPLDWIGVSYVWLEWPFTLVMTVWLINLFNFMDGIDGIAGSEAIFVFGGYAVLGTVIGQNSGFLAPALLLVAATAGFLIWNWQPARIFMGDAGSGFLGLMLAVAAVAGAKTSTAFGVAMLILPAAFVADATVTVLRRAIVGAPVFEAHRSHAYQIAARRRGNHAVVTIASVAINLFFLLPVAALVATMILSPLAGMVIAYLPLMTAAWLYGAGDPEA